MKDKDTCYNGRFSQSDKLETVILDVRRPQTCNGKKVMTWDFKPVGTNKSYEVEVAYHVDSIDGMYFVASNIELGLSLKSADIEQLRKAVKSKLALISIDIQSLQWEDWLEVKVSGSGSHFNEKAYTGMGAELKVSVSRLKRGWHEATQRYVTIGSNGLVYEFPKSSEFTPRPTPSLTDDLDWLTADMKPQTAYIPDTKENMDALKDIQYRLAALQNKLMELLHQDAISESISNLKMFLPDLRKNQ